MIFRGGDVVQGMRVKVVTEFIITKPDAFNLETNRPPSQCLGEMLKKLKLHLLSGNLCVVGVYLSIIIFSLKLREIMYS